MTELSWLIETVMPWNYAKTLQISKKRFTPIIDGVKLTHIYIRDPSEVEGTAKTAIKLDLTSKGYIWNTEV